jgi:hypothetical protein
MSFDHRPIPGQCAMRKKQDPRRTMLPTFNPGTELHLRHAGAEAPVPTHDELEGTSRRDALLNPTAAYNPYGFGELPGFQDDRYTDHSAVLLYPRWRGTPFLVPSLVDLPLAETLRRVNLAFSEDGPWTLSHTLNALGALATHIALAPKPGVPKIHLLNHKGVRAAIVACLEDPSPMQEDTRLRCRAIAIEYVRLLASAVQSRELDAQETFEALTCSDLPGRPPVLLALSSAAAGDVNVAMALCDFFSYAKAPGERYTQHTVDRLLKLRHRGGLKQDDKYDSFFGRIFGDGSAAGRPGATIAAYRLHRLGLMPDDKTIERHHRSPRRAEKWALCRQRGQDWGQEKSYGGSEQNDLEGAAARLLQRVVMETNWAYGDAGHFPAIPKVPAALPRATLAASIGCRFRPPRGEPRHQGAAPPDRSAATSRIAPSRPATMLHEPVDLTP